RGEADVLSPLVFHDRGIGIYRTLGTRWRAVVRRSATGRRWMVHDLRRSAVRNMLRAGVLETVAMSISGHRSRSVFDRYQIVSPRDQAIALAKVEGYVAEQREGNV